jgi:hypothetical protein
MQEGIYGLTLKRTSTQHRWNMSAMHAHQNYELYFLLSGQRRYFLGNTIYDVSPGNIVFIPKNLLHRTVCLGSKGFDRYVINFSQEHFEHFQTAAGRDPFAAYPMGACLQLPTNAVRQVQKNIEEMEQELNHPDHWTKAAVTQGLYNILLISLRTGKPKDPCQEEIADKIQQAAKYISEHYADWLTLEDAARIAQMEKTYFCKRFKALTGFGFLEYLTQTRLQGRRPWNSVRVLLRVAPQTKIGKPPNQAFKKPIFC